MLLLESTIPDVQTWIEAVWDYGSVESDTILLAEKDLRSRLTAPTAKIKLSLTSVESKSY